MAITTEIFETWRHPARVIRRKIAAGTEAGALVVLMGACGLMFVAQWPRLSREAHFNSLAPNAAELPELEAMLGISLFALMFMAPLVFYALAALSRLVVRGFGLNLTGLGSRLALFWALLATTPLMLFHGLLLGFVGHGAAVTGTGIVILLAFLWLWFRLVREAAR